MDKVDQIYDKEVYDVLQATRYTPINHGTAPLSANKRLYNTS